VDISVKKARTATYFDMPTEEIGKLSQRFDMLVMKNQPTMMVEKELDALQAELAELKKDWPEIPEAYAVQDEKFGKDTAIQIRGEQFKKGEIVPRGFLTVLGGQKLPPNTKGSGRLELANWIASKDNPLTTRVIVNRLWHYHFGQGIVPTTSDFGSRGTIPSHPELLALLAKEFSAHQFDFKWLLTELANTKVYQRSSKVDMGKTPEAPALFATAIEKRLSAEQLLASILVATGRYGKLERKGGNEPEMPDALKVKFAKAFANAARDPEDEIAFSLKAALFLLNDEAVLGLLKPETDSTVAVLMKMKPDNVMIEKAYLAILSRKPEPQETKDALDFLSKPVSAGEVGVVNLVWALLASSEFNLNH
jgi:hypothetical protein